MEDYVVTGIVGMSYNWLFIELWVTCLQDVGKLSFAFPCAVNRLSMTP